MPVICIGNLTAGGSGKTPAALALMAMIRENKLARDPFFLSRGYGGSLHGPLQVDPAKHTASEVGDEPLLLAQSAPTIIARKRDDGARECERLGADLILMDDGMQNPSLYKDLTILVVHGGTGFGNSRLLPAGPLREPLDEGLARTDAVLLIGVDTQNVHAFLPANLAVFEGRIEPSSALAKNTSYVAFAGLAHPDKFKDTLLEMGANIAAWHAFPDHHTYSQADLDMLEKQARDLNARLITTEKDAARLPEIFKNDAPLDVLPVSLVWTNPGTVLKFLRTHLGLP